MAELADALDSGSSGRKAVGVQVPLFAPKFELPICAGDGVVRHERRDAERGTL